MESGILSKGEKIFQGVINLILMLMALTAILPFVLLLMSSVTDEGVLLSEGYSFFPSVFSGYAYKYLFDTNGLSVLKSYGVTFLVTGVGTALSLLIGWPNAGLSIVQNGLCGPQGNQLLCVFYNVVQRWTCALLHHVDADLSCEKYDFCAYISHVNADGF